MIKAKTQNRRVNLKYKKHKYVMDSRTLEIIKKEAAKEFPDDEALQQVHIARKIISLEAKAKGMTLIDYVTSQK